MARHVDIIVFDLDGTLVDSRKDIVKAVNFTLKAAGLKEKSFDEITSYIGTGVTDLMRRALAQGNENLLVKSVAVFEEYYNKHLTDETILYPHVKNVLEYFRYKKMMIVTNKRKNMARATLEAFGIDKYFDYIVGGDDDACLKPRACPINKGMDFLMKDRGSAVLVGDMNIDVLAGKNAGIFTCGVTYGIGKKEDILKAGPDYVIDDILELKNIIE